MYLVVIVIGLLILVLNRDAKNSRHKKDSSDEREEEDETRSTVSSRTGRSKTCLFGIIRT